MYVACSAKDLVNIYHGPSSLQFSTPLFPTAVETLSPLSITEELFVLFFLFPAFSACASVSVAFEFGSFSPACLFPAEPTFCDAAAPHSTCPVMPPQSRSLAHNVPAAATEVSLTYRRISARNGPVKVMPDRTENRSENFVVGAPSEAETCPKELRGRSASVEPPMAVRTESTIAAAVGLDFACADNEGKEKKLLADAVDAGGVAPSEGGSSGSSSETQVSAAASFEFFPRSLGWWQVEELLEEPGSEEAGSSIDISEWSRCRTATMQRKTAAKRIGEPMPGTRSMFGNIFTCWFET